MNINQLTASRIKEIRNEKGLTAEAVAKELQISKAAYSHLENGKVEITLNRVETLAQVFNVSISQIIPTVTTNTQIFNGNGGDSRNSHTSHTLINLLTNSEENLDAVLRVIRSAILGNMEK